jgi:transposase
MKRAKFILEQKVTTTPEAMKWTLTSIPQSLIALETGPHSPWVSRLLTQPGHEVIVAHERNVRLIRESRRKDDRIDANASTVGAHRSAATESGAAPQCEGADSL